MWVWYCRPPIGAHFHPTPQPPPVPQQLGEKAHLRIAWSVAAVFGQCDGQRAADTGARPHIAVDTGDGACRRSPLGGRTRLVIVIIIIVSRFL